MDARVDRLQRRCAAEPSVLGLSGGLPADETFPVRALARALARTGRDALQYDWPEGRAELREWIAVRLEKRGARVSPEDVLITSGAQQAIDIALSLAARAGETIDVPAACYPAALDLFRAREVSPVPQSADAAASYAMPVVANPTGLALEDGERTRLLASTKPLIEDDAYADLRFDRSAPEPLLASARERVFYVGTFSKTLCPGLRVGFLVMPPSERERARTIKRVTDLQANTLAQAIVERYVKQNDFDARLAWLSRYYARRADALMTTVRRELPELRFEEPAGGFSLWVESDEPGDDVDLLATAVRHGVSFDPGRDFRASGRSERLCFRLTFSSLPYERIDEAVARLARALHAYRRERPSRGARPTLSAEAV